MSEGARFVSCAVWKPKSLNVSQLGSNLHVAFEQAPSSFGFTLYYLYYKLRQDGPFRLQRCHPVSDGGGGMRSHYLSIWGSVSSCGVSSCRGRLVNKSKLVLK